MEATLPAAKLKPHNNRLMSYPSSISQRPQIRTHLLHGSPLASHKAKREVMNSLA